MSDEGVRFIRNLRPNGVNIRVAGLKLHLDRRGARADAIAVPDAAFADRGFQTNFGKSLIEEISKEDFYALALRVEDSAQERLTFERVRYDISPDNPTIRIFAKDSLSPRIDFADGPTDTEKDAERLRKQADKENAAAAKKIAAKRAPRKNSRNTITHEIEPRKGIIKGVTGGDVIDVMDTGEDL